MEERSEPIPISSPFGMRTHPTTGDRRMHDGIDLMLPVGAPIYAVASGRVRTVRVDHPVSGNAITLDLPEGWTAFYAHLSAVDVMEGEIVRRGQYMGDVGATGRVTGPHLHFSLYDPQGEPVDPIRMFEPGQFYPV